MKNSINTIFNSFLIVGILSGCATITGTGKVDNNSSSVDSCNAATAAMIGGTIGLLLGSRDADAGRGAVIGAAVGAMACGLYNTVTSKLIKSSHQADEAYKKANGGRLPDTPAVVAYNAKIGSSQYKRGQTVIIKSSVELVNGTREPIKTVREELVMLDTDGKPSEVSKKNKPFTATAGGAYENSFEFTFPDQAPQRRYDFMTKLYVNDKLIQTQTLQTQVASDGQTYEIYAMN